MNSRIRYLATLAYAFSAVVLGSAAGPDISKVNGSVRLEAGQVAGDVSTVNGSVTIGTDASAEEVETVNGSMQITDRARVRSAETVNGSIGLGAGAVVTEGVSAVNGSMTLGQGAQVGGRLENVNGRMRLDGAQVSGGIDTVNGDIYLASNSRVSGGIHYEKNHQSWWKNSSTSSHNPRLTVERGVVVEGPLHFEREVDIYAAPGVTLPEVTGTPPRRYTLE
jgi:DUF4097 and DUF4098 domain-containing protein YvlB